MTSRLVGQMVALRRDAPSRTLVVEHDGQVVKRLALHGVGGGMLPYEAYVARMQAEARSDAVRQQRDTRQRRGT